MKSKPMACEKCSLKTRVIFVTRVGHLCPDCNREYRKRNE